MVAFKGHFDGRVIVPVGPVDLPRDRELVFQVKPSLPKGTDGRALLKLLDAFDPQSAQEIGQAIEAECERIDDEWSSDLDRRVGHAARPDPGRPR